VSALDKAKASGRSKALLPIRRNKAQHFVAIPVTTG
jgi:hypothetical protein